MPDWDYSVRCQTKIIHLGGELRLPFNGRIKIIHLDGGLRLPLMEN